MKDIVAELKTLLADNPGWDKLLLDSITEAKAKALQAGMAEAKGWPDDLEGYYDYLHKAVRMVPRQDYPRETFIALARFYWFLDQPPGKKLQESQAFNRWMHDFAIGAAFATPPSRPPASTRSRPIPPTTSGSTPSPRVAGSASTTSSQGP
jgi:hypothetical protein